MKMRIVRLSMAMLFAAACSTAGREITQTFEFDYPDTEPAAVVLDMRTGTLNLRPVAGNSVRGQVTTNVDQWRVSQTVTEDGAPRIVQGESRNQVIPNATNRWDVEVGTGQPLALTINLMAASSNLELGGIPLTALTLTGTSGSQSLDYRTPNPLDDGGRLRIDMKTGDVTVSGLFNSRIRELTSITTGGDQTIEFGGGELVQDIRGNIETSTGNVTLRIPNNIGVRVTFTGASGRVMEVSPEFIEVSRNVYETAQYADGEGPRVQIAVRTTAGDLRLIAVPPL